MVQRFSIFFIPLTFGLMQLSCFPQHQKSIQNDATQNTEQPTADGSATNASKELSINDVIWDHKGLNNLEIIFKKEPAFFAKKTLLKGRTVPFNSSESYNEDFCYIGVKATDNLGIDYHFPILSIAEISQPIGANGITFMFDIDKNISDSYVELVDLTCVFNSVAKEQVTYGQLKVILADLLTINKK